MFFYLTSGFFLRADVRKKMDVKNDVRQGLLSKEDTNSKLVNSPADLAGGIGPRSSGGRGVG